ncbi:hypothetical protein MYSTI_07869 [Myxococcus stipitatus DSM 14675]|uniref:Uncharacterized protein n=1 Tax=Myxococcus stipitatus (strain DSM 14675 / JCM 12634 / Mx s8) TaxID=1278073 RepID=L7UJH0_MYXSD|nr:hypothetical protein [Myxococcus stipitatus]AGC49141.1 hypothetical protein MYSTI_07869 [Myxococcus stipitatus DSM 14675]
MSAPGRLDVSSSAVSPLRPSVRPSGSGGFVWLQKSLGAVAATAGCGLIVFGLLGLGVSVPEVVSPSPGSKYSTWVFGLVSSLVFVGLGRFLWKKGLSPFRLARQREQLLGFVRAQLRLRVTDAAAHLKVSEAEAEAELSVLLARHEVDLVFLPETREYVHREVHERGRDVARTCPSCDAPVSAERALPGEKVVCSYCQSAFLVG